MTIALLLLIIAAICATLALVGVTARVNLNSIAILIVAAVLMLDSAR